MRCLITGINGFVGGHLARRLRDGGAEVFGFDLSGGENVFAGDLSDRSALRRALETSQPQTVFHLAGLLRAAQYEELYRANLLGTIALFEALVELGQKPLVILASSSAVYGLSSGPKPLTEKSPLRPLTHYAVSKAAQETAALRFFDSHRIPVTILRLFNLLGAGQSPQLAFSAWAKQIVRAEKDGGGEILTGSLDSSRDFVDVRDAVRALDLAAEKALPGEVYNVCSGRAATMRECLDIMLSLSPHPIKARLDPSRLQKDDIPVQAGSARKLNRLTGWKPQISLAQSLADLLDDWRRRIELELE
ncbi:MAG: GDP-mannose 4,6-dehydratase [Chloroflexi bacterium]|nr:GDP-mannose 4,6-dehydratase [Chloroflexota bacterium]